ncbi:MAG TPA: divalent-cation tolerance protein CutA [Pyrinomonadaceae bacterium]|jgi:periplasmic divalent cation tolerance protein
MASESSEAIVVFMTAGSREEAERLAQALVSKRLAACVQILPEMQSVYWWQGQIENAREIPILAKTVRSKFAELERQVRSLHSYETPEIIALPITEASAPYLEWLRETVGSP